MVLKVLTAAVWVWALASLFAPGVPLASWGPPILAVLVGVHAVECVAFLPRLRAAGGSLGNHLLQTFLFGFIHVRTTPRLAPGG